MKYQNYKVMVAGATSGIGLAIAKMFLKEGATVIALGRNFSKVEDLGERFIPCVCDVTDSAQLEEACNFVKEKFGGKLDIVVNSAGLAVPEHVSNVPVERFDLAINLLLRPSVMMTAYLCGALSNCDSKKPVIVHISSAASRAISPGNFLYGICKHAVNLYAKQSAAGLPGIRIFSVSPGTFDTPIFNRDTAYTDEQRYHMFEKMTRGIPSGRIGDPAEIGELISFLCSDEASYMTGSDCLIDGGIMTMSR